MKKILITYLNDGSINSHAEKEAMWFKVTSEYNHLAKTRVISTMSKKLIEFEDGTIIEMLPVGNIRGHRATHVYASKSLENSNLMTVAMATVIVSGRQGSFDLEGKSRDERFKVFSMENGKLVVDNS